MRIVFETRDGLRAIETATRFPGLSIVRAFNNTPVVGVLGPDEPFSPDDLVAHRISTRRYEFQRTVRLNDEDYHFFREIA
jgi:hypothetical protein